jgi:hypothetical protein
MQRFDRIQTDDSILNRIQDRLKAVINAIAGKPIIDGQIITATITPGGVSIPHGLGRVPNGWILISGGVTNFVSSTDTPCQTTKPDARFLYLIMGQLTLTNAKLWVF